MAIDALLGPSAQHLLDGWRIRAHILQRFLRLPRRHHPAHSSTRPLRVHLGHHFWGAGNVGDDYMLAGFLREIHRRQAPLRMTCCVPENIGSLRRRFPQIEWLDYTIANRWRAIEAADCWLGLGGTPFQSDIGDWCERHLDRERMICAALGRTMHFLGVGAEHARACRQPRARRVIAASRQLWMRDPHSANCLPPEDLGHATIAADLANLLFADVRFPVQSPPPPPLRTIGFLLNFENLAEEVVASIPALLDALEQPTACWLVQDGRPLPGMELDWFQKLPEAIRQRLSLTPLPTVADLSDHTAHPPGWPEVVITSRYHGGLLAAWAGSRVVVVARSGKLAGLAEQLGLGQVASIRNVDQITSLVREAQPVDRNRLASLTAAASSAVGSWLDEVWPMVRGVA